MHIDHLLLIKAIEACATKARTITKMKISSINPIAPITLSGRISNGLII